MTDRPAPRLFGIRATRAPVVAVLRRGPSGWSHAGRWDVERRQYEPGSWIHSNLYPERCDLSPDGRWLCYFTLRGGQWGPAGSGRWAAGATYVAVSRLPWLTALAAWGTCGTWSRGAHFVEDPRQSSVPAPDEGSFDPRRLRLGLAATAPDTFAVERRRGWVDAAGTPPRDREGDPWDERRAARVVVERRRPGRGAEAALRARGRYAAFRDGPHDPAAIGYELVVEGGVRPLPDVQWADWDETGRLLVATRDGRLQIRTAPFDAEGTEWEADLSALEPDPQPPPDEARRW